jgi:hypothetical protein
VLAAVLNNAVYGRQMEMTAFTGAGRGASWLPLSYGVPIRRLPREIGFTTAESRSEDGVSCWQ